MICLICCLKYLNTLYTSYFFQCGHLADSNKTSSRGFSDFTDLPCSLQMEIAIGFFWTKFLVVYYLSIVIAMIYTWHRTVRLFSCLLTLSFITLIIFGSDYILYFQYIHITNGKICTVLTFVFATLDAVMPHNDQDPLSGLCGYHISLDDRDEFLQNNSSIYARFYRWSKKLKRYWNIEEEKLIITAVAGVITSFTIITLNVYILLLYGY